MGKQTSTGSRRRRLRLAAVLALLAVGIVAALAGGAFASGVDTSVVDAIAPTGSVTLAPGDSGSITINLSVTGSQAGTATFQINRNWTLSGGTFTGSNPQTFTVPPRAGGDPATTFQTTGTVTVSAGQADGGPFTLQVGAFNITNDNQQGGKLGAGASSSYNITVQTPAPSDTTAPTVNVSTHNSVPASSWFATSPQQVDVSAYDASGVTNIECSIDGGGFANASSQAGAGTSAGSPRAGNVSVSGDGSHVVVCRATDGASPANTGAAAGSTASVTVNIDTTGPTVNCTVPDQSGWYADNVSVNCTASDTRSDLADSTDDASFTLSTNVASGSENGSAQTGTRTVFDNAGNSTTAGPYIFKVDRKAPVISDDGTTDTPTGNDGVNDWFNHDVTVDFSATDGGSGVACTTPWTKTTSGEGTNVTVSSGACADNVDNNNPGITSSGYHIDKTKPTVHCTVPDQTTWYATNQTVTCTASDGGSDLADSADASFTLSTNVSAGNETASAQTLSETVYDNAGNSTTAGPYTFKIDRKAPQQSSCDSPDGNWHPDDVTLHCTYTDGGSGPASQQIALTTSVAAGTETNNATASANGAQACDNVLNCATSPSDITGNKIDKKAPVISDDGTTDTPTGNDGVNDWFNHDVTVDFSATDGGSGLASTCPSPWTANTSGEGMGRTGSSGACADKVGNSNPGITSSGYNVDKTKPDVSVTGVTDGATYTLGSVPSAGCSTTDGLSGVNTQATLSTSGGPVGSITATCSGGQDNAGNTNSASVTYSVHYIFTGFFQPVDNPPTCNSVKAGQAIPVKFSLHGYQGLNIFALGSPSVSAGSCSGVPLDSVETTVTAGNSSLSYDWLSDQYTYVWKTDKAWAGKAMRLSVELADGTTQYARFSFTK